MKVALYIRVSTNDKQESSLEAQRQALESYCSARGWSIVHCYEERASGTKDSRPELMRLMLDAKRRRFDLVMVSKLDRFGRSLRHLINGLNELQQLGVQFASLNDAIDLTTASGRFQIQILAAVGEFEACMIRERVRSGLKHAKSKGKVLGRKSQLTTEVAEQLRVLKQSGLSIREISSRLNVSKSAVFNWLKAGTV